MPEKNTPQLYQSQDPPCQKTESKQYDRLRGAPLAMVCPAIVFRDEMGIAPETWKLLVAAGMPLIPVGKSRLLIVAKAVEFLESNPPLGPRPSVARKQRYLKRKAKKK